MIIFPLVTHNRHRCLPTQYLLTISFCMQAREGMNMLKSALDWLDPTKAPLKAAALAGIDIRTR